jgi:hypothetical protein
MKHPTNLCTAPTNLDVSVPTARPLWKHQMKIRRCFPEWIRYTLFYTGVLCLSASSIRGSVPQFQLRDTEGRVHTSSEWVTHKAIVLFFVTNDCPVTNSMSPK